MRIQWKNTFQCYIKNFSGISKKYKAGELLVALFLLVDFEALFETLLSIFFP